MKKKILLGCGCILLFILCIVTLLGGMTAYAFNTSDNIPVFSDIVERIERTVLNQTTMRPILEEEVDKISLETFQNISDIEFENLKFDFSGSLNANAHQEELDVEITFNGNVVQNENKESEINATINTSSGGVSASFDVDVKSFQETSEMFLILRNVPQLFGQLDSDLQKKPILVNMEEGFRNINSNMDQENIDHFKNVLKSDVFMNNIKRVDDQVFGSKRAACYSLDLDQKDLLELDKVNGDTPLSDEADSLERLVLELCLDRINYRLYSLGLNVVAKNLEMRFSVNNVEYLDTLERIERPTDYITIEDALSGIFGSRGFYNY